MDWKTPVTQQLFVSREGRGVVTFMLMTYCLLASCVIYLTPCVCVCVSLMYGTGVVGSTFPFPQCVSFESEI